jgi:glycosyltransferase involved in cell wall biosynthesis
MTLGKDMHTGLEASDLHGSPRPLEVMLFRNVPEERRFSMERYADEVARALREHPELRVRATMMHLSSRAARWRIGALDSYLVRLARYPLAAGRQRADVFHVIDQGYAHLAMRLPPERTIVTCHDLMLLRAEEGVTGFRGRRTSVVRFRWSVGYMRRVAHVICVSESTRDDVIRLVGVNPDRTSVVYSGVGERFRRLPVDRIEQVRRELGAHGSHLVLSVSTGHVYKNPLGVLRTVALLRRQGLDVKLVWCGSPFSPEQQRISRQLDLEGAIVHCGIVSDERLVEIYNACDVLLFPSHYEGFGWPALEAMACGLPVVASMAPALIEAVGDAALTVDANDHHALANAIAVILDSADVRNQLRSAGLERASAFTWTRAADEISAVYQQVAAAATTDGAARDLERDRSRSLD